MPGDRPSRENGETIKPRVVQVKKVADVFFFFFLKKRVLEALSLFGSWFFFKECKDLIGIIGKPQTTFLLKLDLRFGQVNIHRNELFMR